MGKRKTAKGKSPRKRSPRKRSPASGRPPIRPETIDKIVLLLVSSQSREAIKTAAANPDGLNVPPDQVDAAIAEAEARIYDAAAASVTAEIGAAIVRLRDLYARALRTGDVRSALSSQKELSKLLGLYQTKRQPAESPGPDDAIAAELAATRDYLEPLGLGPEADGTAELARLAVAEITRLRLHAQ